MISPGAFRNTVYLIVMKKAFILLFSFFVFFQTNAQDSLRVMYCIYSGMDCYGFPTMDKNIEHFDSLGRVSEINMYHIEGCTGTTSDSDFIPTSDIFFVYDTASKIIEQTSFNYYGQDTTQYIQTYTYDAWNYLTMHRTNIISQWQTSVTDFDSIAYNLNHDKVYEL